MDSISAVLEQMIPDLPQPDSGLAVDQITIELPLELHVRGAAGPGVVLEASGPRQRAATSIVPVFHRLRVRVDARQEPAL